MTGYQVVPEALRKNAKVIMTIADAWAEVDKLLAGALMGPEDLGLLGERVRAPEGHNLAVNAVHEKIRSGLDALNRAADTMKTVADDYESREAEYYEQFGLLQQSSEQASGVWR